VAPDRRKTNDDLTVRQLNGFREEFEGRIHRLTNEADPNGRRSIVAGGGAAEVVKAA